MFATRVNALLELHGYRYTHHNCGIACQDDFCARKRAIMYVVVQKNLTGGQMTQLIRFVLKDDFLTFSQELASTYSFGWSA